MPLVATSQQLRVSPCWVRGFSFSLDLAWVRGVERADRITLMHGGWPQVGILPTATGELPVFSLAGLLGLPEHANQPGEQLLLIETPSGPLGLLVDQTEQGLSVSAADFMRMPTAAMSEHFTAVVRTEAKLLPWLDPVGLFTGRPTRELPHSVPWRQRRSTTSQTRLMVIPLPHSEHQERKWLVGIPALAVVELVEARDIIAVPGTPSHVNGVMLWQDRVIGVLDLCRWLRITPDASDQSWVAILALPGTAEPIGLRIPRGVRMLKLPLPNIPSERPFPGSSERLVASVEMSDATIGLLDLASFHERAALIREPIRGIPSSNR